MKATDQNIKKCLANPGRPHMNYEGFSQFHDLQFSGAIAIYPFCSFARGPHRAPLMIVSAAKDDYVSTQVCERTADQTQADQYPITFHKLSDAYHGFDIPAFGPVHRAERDEINPDGFSAGSGTLGYNASGASELFDLVRDFLSTISSQ